MMDMADFKRFQEMVSICFKNVVVLWWLPFRAGGNASNLAKEAEGNVVSQGWANLHPFAVNLIGRCWSAVFILEMFEVIAT